MFSIISATHSRMLMIIVNIEHSFVTPFVCCVEMAHATGRPLFHRDCHTANDCLEQPKRPTPDGPARQSTLACCCERTEITGISFIKQETVAIHSWILDTASEIFISRCDVREIVTLPSGSWVIRFSLL